MLLKNNSGSGVTLLFGSISALDGAWSKISCLLLHILFVTLRELNPFLSAQPRRDPLPDRHLHADLVADVDAGQFELTLLLGVQVVVVVAAAVDVVDVAAGHDLEGLHPEASLVPLEDVGRLVGLADVGHVVHVRRGQVRIHGGGTYRSYIEVKI